MQSATQPLLVSSRNAPPLPCVTTLITAVQQTRGDGAKHTLYTAESLQNGHLRKIYGRQKDLPKTWSSFLLYMRPLSVCTHLISGRNHWTTWSFHLTFQFSPKTSITYIVAVKTLSHTKYQIHHKSQISFFAKCWKIH